MSGSARGRTRNRRAWRNQAGHHQQTVPVCFESSWRNRWSVLRWSSGHGGGVWQWRQTILSATLYYRTRGFATTVRHNSLSNKEKQLWVIRGKKTKAKGNNRKSPRLIQRKNENWKKKRRNKCSVLFGDLKSSTEVVSRLLKETIQTVANGSLTSVAVGWARALRTSIAPIKVFGCSSVVGVRPHNWTWTLKVFISASMPFPSNGKVNHYASIISFD